MKLEKTFQLPTGRIVKVLTKKSVATPTSYSDIELEVLIKEPKEDDFRPPIGITHPKYWKLKNLNKQDSQLIEIQYSGLSDKQVRNARKEFEKIISSGN